jgi:hypothetical protein
MNTSICMTRIGRRGRLLTNFDSEAYAYVQAAIDAAARAVGEQLAAV